MEKEEPSPLDDTPSVDSTHLLEDESSTLSSTFGVNEATVSDSENSPVATECNDDPNGILDDNDNFILADDGILDGFQCTAIGRGEEQQMGPTPIPVAIPIIRFWIGNAMETAVNAFSLSCATKILSTMLYNA